MNSTNLVRRLKKRAQHGDATAQYYLSIMYEDARYVERDLSESATWCLQAADSGDRQAQYRIWRMLQDGRGFDKPHLRAAWYWLEQAAQAGHVEARFELGIRYLFGAYGVRKSARKAQTWLLASAHASHAEANYYLGYMYLHGCGVAEDVDQAFQYLSRAVELHSVKAACSLAFMLEHGIGCFVDRARSKQLYESAANCGHAGAQMYLATELLMLGEYAEAIVRLEQAANDGLSEAQAFLARLLSCGPAEIRDRSRALFWCLVVFHADDPESCLSLQPFKSCLDNLVASATRDELDDANLQVVLWHHQKIVERKLTQIQETGGNNF